MDICTGVEGFFLLALKICQQDSVNLQKCLNDFSKSVLLDWGPLNDV